MKEMPNLSDLTAEFVVHIQSLKELAGQVSRLGDQITEMTGRQSSPPKEISTRSPVEYPTRSPLVLEPKYSSPFKEAISTPSNIIPFPGPGKYSNKKPEADSDNLQKDKFLSRSALLAGPGKPLPSDIFDYRPFLQRDGLILLAWDKRETENGELYTAYWVTSTGIPRFYASKPYPSSDFFLALPNHKSYAAEDGIEFYGQKSPDYLVHVAPELMKSNPKHRELRTSHIETLKSEGSIVDFTYTFLLKTAKKRNPPRKFKNGHQQGAGA